MELFRSGVVGRMDQKCGVKEATGAYEGQSNVVLDVDEVWWEEAAYRS